MAKAHLAYEMGRRGNFLGFKDIEKTLVGSQFYRRQGPNYARIGVVFCWTDKKW